MCGYLMPCRQATTISTTVYQLMDDFSEISTLNIHKYLTMPPTISYKSNSCSQTNTVKDKGYV